jgi:hypothetical protein
MHVHISPDYRTELQLCNDVMGIALAVWGHAEYCDVFRTLDKALDQQNMAQLTNIREAFNRLPLTSQVEIMSDTGHERPMAAIDRLRENIALLTTVRLARTA